MAKPTQTSLFNNCGCGFDADAHQHLIFCRNIEYLGIFVNSGGQRLSKHGDEAPSVAKSQLNRIESNFLCGEHRFLSCRFHKWQRG